MSNLGERYRRDFRRRSYRVPRYDRNDIEPRGQCAHCNNWTRRRDLREQDDYRGGQAPVGLGFFVCPRCYFKPNPQGALQTLPPDPETVMLPWPNTVDFTYTPPVYVLGFLPNPANYQTGYQITVVDPTPNYSLNFATNTYVGLDPADIVCTRSSVAWGDDSTGTWSEFAINTMVRTDRGDQVYEARTNSIRNSSEQGALAGSPGTLPTFHTSSFNPAPLSSLTLSVIGTGVASGLEYIELHFSGTSSASGASIPLYLFDSTTQIVAALGQRWNTSAFVTLVGGSTAHLTSFILRVDERNSGGGALAASSVSLLGISAGVLGQSRFNAGRTITQATTAFVSAGLYVDYPSGAVIDVTFRLAREQLESSANVGLLPSSPIRTTSAAATRAADVLSVPITVTDNLPILLSTSGFPTQANSYAPAQYLAAVDDGSVANFIGSGRRQGNDVAATFASAGPAPVSTTIWTQNLQATLDFLDQDGNGLAVFNGGRQLVSTTAGFPTGMNTLHIGCDPAGASQWDGYITEIEVSVIDVTEGLIAYADGDTWRFYDNDAVVSADEFALLEAAQV